MSLIEDLKKYYQVDPEPISNEDIKFRWKIHEEMPDSSFRKSENAKSNIEYYSKAGMDNETRLWLIELRRLREEYPLIHKNKGE